MTALVRERPEVRFAIAQQLDGRPRRSATSNDAVSVRFHPDDVERRSNCLGCRWRKGRLVAQTGGSLPGGACERASSYGGAGSSGRQRHPGRAGVVRVLPWLRWNLDSPEPAEKGHETNDSKNRDGRSPPRSSSKLAEVFNHTHKAP
jgi:hypothetical protein